MKSKLLTTIFLIFLTLPAILPLFQPGFFPMHDDQQVARLYQLDLAISHGHFPVRWVKDLGFGYGYPLFNFYPPLVYYLGWLFTLLGTGYITSIKLVFALAFTLSSISMYLWARHHYPKIPALIAALFYTYAPYHAVDAYVRGALAELFSFVWLPLILLTIDKFFKARTNPDKIKSGLSFTLFFSLLTITHNLVVLPFSLIIGIYFLVKLLDNPHKLVNIKYFSLFTILSIASTAFFWLPALTEKHFTLVDDILLQERYTYSLHYVEISQLWNSIWGYAGSAPPGEIDGFSLKIGKLHIILSILAFSLILPLSKKLTQLSKPHTSQIATIFALFLLQAFMTTRYSSFIWDSFSPLQYIQFPWRFLEFAVLFSSFLAASFATIIIKQVNSSFAKNLVLLTISLLLLYPNLKLFKPQSHLDVTDSHYTNDDFLKWNVSKTSFEFSPKGIDTTTAPLLNITQVNITPDQIPESLFETITGEVEVFPILDHTSLKSFSISSNSGGVIKLNTFNFPGWTANLNGEPTTIIDNNPLKLITLAIPPGNHTLVVEFTNTLPRAVGNYTSLISILVFMAFAFHQSGLTKKIASIL